MAATSDIPPSFLNPDRTTPVLRASDLVPEEWERAFAWMDARGDRRVNYRACARALGDISHETLSARHAKRDSSVSRPGPQPRLGVDVEDLLVDYVKQCQAMGMCVNEAQLMNKAKELAARLNVTDNVGGNKWLELFYGRHPDLAKRQAQLIEISRVTGINRDAVERYFDILELALAGVPPERTWIADETKISRDSRSANKVGMVAPRTRTHSLKRSLHSPRRWWRRRVPRTCTCRRCRTSPT